MLARRRSNLVCDTLTTGARRDSPGFCLFVFWVLAMAFPRVAAAVELPSLHLVSRAEQSIATRSVGGNSPSVSGDGRYAAFVSAGILVQGQVDQNETRDVFLVDRQTGTVRLVSHAAGAPLRAGNADSSNPRISADGQFVAFTSAATDLVPGVLPGAFGVTQLYLYSQLDGSIMLVSHRHGAPTTAGSGTSSSPVLS